MQLRRIRSALVGVTALAAVFVVPVGAHAESGFTPVGSLERAPQEAIDAFGDWVARDGFDIAPIRGTLLPVPGAGQLWQVFPSSGLDIPPPGTGVLVRDARTLHVEGSFLLPLPLARAGIHPVSGEWLHTTDGGSRVYLVTKARELVEIDAATFAVRRLGTLSVTPAELPGSVRGLDLLIPAGLAWDEHTGELLVLYGGPPANSVLNRVTVLQRIDPITLGKQSRVIRSCHGPLPQTDVSGETYGAELLVEADAVYVACHVASASQLVPAAVQAIVVQLPRASLWDNAGSEASVGAGWLFDAALVDRTSGRIAVMDVIGRVTVVDARTMTVAGTFETSFGAMGRTGAGLDQATGRFFFQSNAGLGSVDLRTTPLPTPTIAPSLAADGQERILPQGNRVLVLPGHGQQRPDRYTVYNVGP